MANYFFFFAALKAQESAKRDIVQNGVDLNLNQHHFDSSDKNME